MSSHVTERRAALGDWSMTVCCTCVLGFRFSTASEHSPAGRGTNDQLALQLPTPRKDNRHEP
jgi:hypothetical protein